MRDFDCKDGDESKIVIIFDSSSVGFLNLKNNSFHAKNMQETVAIYGTQGPKSIKLIKYLPTLDFTILSETNIDNVAIATVELVSESDMGKRELIADMGSIWKVW